jgi:hypothetical protein
MWAITVFASDRRRPIGVSTAATSSHRPSACALVPDTMTTKSSAYADIGISPHTAPGGRSPVPDDDGPFGRCCFPPGLVEVIVEDREGDAGKQRRRVRRIWPPWSRWPCVQRPPRPRPGPRAGSLGLRPPSLRPSAGAAPSLPARCRPRPDRRRLRLRCGRGRGPAGRCGWTGQLIAVEQAALGVLGSVGGGRFGQDAFYLGPYQPAPRLASSAASAPIGPVDGDGSHRQQPGRRA